MSHSRGIVLLIAVVLTILIATFVYKNKIVNYLLYIPFTGIFLVMDKLISRYVKHGVYGNYGTQHASIENFDLQTFMKIFSLRGIIIETKLVIGWIFNLFASSMGLALLGFFAYVIIIVLGLKKKNMTLSENLFAVFSLLCLLGTFALGALYFFPHAYELMTGIKIDRADRMIYGRYMIGAVGPTCLIALYALLCKKNQILKLKLRIASILIYAGVLAVFLWKVCPSLANIPQTNARYFISLSGFLKIVHHHTATEFPDLVSALAKSGIVALLLMIVIVILTSFNRKKVLYSTCVIIFIVSLLNFNHIFTRMRNDRDDAVIWQVKNVIDYCENINGVDEIARQYPAVFKNNTGALTKCYQFGLQKFNVGKLKYIKDTRQQDFLMICKKDSIDFAIAECNRTNKNNHFYLFKTFDYVHARRDVVLVKGDDLANLLIKNGNELIPYNQ